VCATVDHELLIRYDILVLPRNTTEMLTNHISIAEQFRCPFLAVSDGEVELSGYNLAVKQGFRAKLWYNPI
jgi:hypothetical protein